jgi:hypothetical protein
MLRISAASRQRKGLIRHLKTLPARDKGKRGLTYSGKKRIPDRSPD